MARARSHLTAPYIQVTLIYGATKSPCCAVVRTSGKVSASYEKLFAEYEELIWIEMHVPATYFFVTATYENDAVNGGAAMISYGNLAATYEYAP